MTDLEKQEKFLSLFKTLEKECKNIVQEKDDEYLSFSKALNQIYYQHLDPTISDYETYDFIKSAAELRNMLSHENNICYPSEEFLNRFEQVVKEITHPVTCRNIMSRDIISLQKNETLSSAMKKMSNHSLSHLPILDEKRVVLGVFSRSTIFDYLSVYKSLPQNEELTIDLFQEFTPTGKHLNDAFLYVSPETKVKTVYSYLEKRAHEKDLVMILVTKNAERKNPLQGVITISDFAKVKLS